MSRLVAGLSSLVLLAACSLPVQTATVGDWQARCEGVAPNECEGVAGLFVNNLARDQQAVFEQSRGIVTVRQRPACPRVEAWADGSLCWRAIASVDGGRICMVIARSSEGPRGFGQVGGDIVVGRGASPPPDWPSCQ